MSLAASARLAIRVPVAIFAFRAAVVRLAMAACRATNSARPGWVPATC